MTAEEAREIAIDARNKSSNDEYGCIQQIIKEKAKKGFVNITTKFISDSVILRLRQDGFVVTLPNLGRVFYEISWARVTINR